MNKQSIIICLLSLLAGLLSCSPEAIDMDMDADDTEDTPTDRDTTAVELLADTIDTHVFYVTTGIIRDILLSDCPTPDVIYAERMQPYRMPTRREAYSLVNLPIDLPTDGQRCLCYDSPEDNIKIGSSQLGTGDYYTFVWGSGNRPTKAGFKTKYCITPIRVDTLATDTIPNPEPDDDIDDDKDDGSEEGGNEEPDVPNDDVPNDTETEEEEQPDDSFNINDGITISDEATDNMQGD